MAKNKHLHRYLRKNISKKKGKDYWVFVCVNKCSHYIPVELALGKECQCWGCDKPMEMTPYSVERTRPKCLACVKGNQPAAEIDVETFDVDRLLSDLGVKG